MEIHLRLALRTITKKTQWGVCQNRKKRGFPGGKLLFFLFGGAEWNSGEALLVEKIGHGSFVPAETNLGGFLHFGTGNDNFAVLKDGLGRLEKGVPFGSHLKPGEICCR